VSEAVLRILLVLLCGLVCGVGLGLSGWSSQASLLGGALGLAFGLVLLAVERGLERLTGKRILQGTLGLVAGLLLGRLIMSGLGGVTAAAPVGAGALLQALGILGGGYLGLRAALDKAGGASLAGVIHLLREQPRAESYKLLDTSVIIDGRIADITEAGFMEGTLVIPQFILRELQHIADSSDPLKRNRGRRGLDILQKIQKQAETRVEISDREFPDIREVDNKLVALAKVLNAKLVTNDFNLNKVAELHGVGVLNINELTNALRPVVLPGEDMRVYVLKEGKEYNQGIAYLDDGTMVVVDNGRRHIGQTVDVCVTSVLQTTAGRMIFSRLKDEAEAA
jgi:uncharacterized protein YacL